MKSHSKIDTGSAVLWASAFLILAMIIVQAGRIQNGSAHAGMASQHGGYAMVTTDAGQGGDPPNEILYILDSRDEVLLVYEVEDARRGQITLRSGGDVGNVFATARR